MEYLHFWDKVNRKLCSVRVKKGGNFNLQKYHPDIELEKLGRTPILAGQDFNLAINALWRKNHNHEKCFFMPMVEAR